MSVAPVDRVQTGSFSSKFFFVSVAENESRWLVGHKRNRASRYRTAFSDTEVDFDSVSHRTDSRQQMLQQIHGSLEENEARQQQQQIQIQFQFQFQIQFQFRRSTLDGLKMGSDARNGYGKPTGDRKARWGFLLRLLVSLVAALALSGATAAAFCGNGLPDAGRRRTPPLPRSTPYPSPCRADPALGLFRPDWMRRHGRISEKRKEYREVHEALRKRREELGIALLEEGGPSSPGRDKIARGGGGPFPKRYRVVSWFRNGSSDRADCGGSSSSSGNNSSIDETTGENRAENDPLKIYLMVPENEVEATDESNVLDYLEHGEVITAVGERRVAPSDPVRPEVLAASIIYNAGDPSSVLRKHGEVLWIEHDKGGWSPCAIDGVTRLVPIDDDGGGGGDPG